MDVEGYQNKFKTQGYSIGQKKAIILNESVSYDKDNNKNKQQIKNCCFKRIRKNAKYEGIKIIQTIGKRYLLTSNEVRCKFRYISLKKFQLKTKSIDDYVSSFFETTFEKTFLKNFKTLNFSKHDQRESHEIAQTFKSNTSAFSKKQTDQDRITQCIKFEQQESQKKPSSLGQYQESNIHQMVQQQIVDLNYQSSISCEIEEQSYLSNTKTNLRSQASNLNNSDDGYFGKRKNSEETQYELVIQTMFNYLDQIKQNFKYQFSFTDNHINQDQAKANSLYNNKLGIIDEQILNPQMYLNKGFESFMPPIQLKQDKQNKFKDHIIKIFNSFILRGRERRQSSSTSQSNTQAREDLTALESEKIKQIQLLKEKIRKNIDSCASDNDEDQDDEDSEQYINEKESCQVNNSDDKINQLSTNKRMRFQINFEKSYNQDQVNLDELHCNKQSAAGYQINKSYLSTAISNTVVPKNITDNESNFQFQNTENSQANEEQKNESQQKLLEKIRKNSISSPQQNMSSQQSKYHNLKNSFMHLIIQIFTKEVLSCFELPISYLNYSSEVLERMKNYSFKYRPVKGRYQYYSNIHYSTLFLKLNKNTLTEIQQCAHYIQYHKVFFNEDLSNCQKESDFEVIKCNFYKIFIGQIVLFTLQNAEDILLNEIDIKNNQNYLDSSRFNYISKVKKGIQKLQRAKHAIRF
ncbi:hypothetical protein TTHERM_00158160 (macronuclear) [Tetrahymena thermophila SB210]|uniref:Uncharacterized protein n=1 Tax=Tetrahymena thermophila (strain SB210) TaxID=312017 RepID=Q22WB8_TETTS|nr:hypothetical protein TTHERM_00158160 [Tetrahymena thermophila SB210]EAR89499.2 hypothetical protein TTHERM_00158160 [Tetrahymena thermophila SB210]|eukprot:XP_001009744.2 hypothetical protein TTHERM_00158160 [Tetrahymena thermophila SB210]